VSDQATARRISRRWVGAALAPAAIFGVVLALVAVRWVPLAAVDQAVLDRVNGATTARPMLIMVARIASFIGGPVSVDVLTAVAAIGVYVTRRGLRFAAYVVLVRGVELALETAVKVVVDRPRPVTTVVLTTAQGAAFPSGHTAGTAALCAALVIVGRLVWPRVPWVIAGVLLALGATAVAASRIMLGVHYLSDVIGGGALGVFCGVAVAVILLRASRGTCDL
jgi:undecaprenyl-diphosphatase